MVAGGPAARPRLGSSLGLPSVSLWGLAPRQRPTITSFKPGDLLQVDWGVGYLNEWTDMKRTAYVLKKGETAASPGIAARLRQGLAVRDVLYKNIKPGVPASEMRQHLEALVGAMPGYVLTDFGKPHTADPAVHGVPHRQPFDGRLGTWLRAHGWDPISPASIRLRMNEVLEPTNFNSIEFISFTVVPEWQGTRLALNLEDDAMIKAEGLKWLYPPSDRILLIK